MAEGSLNGRPVALAADRGTTGDAENGPAPSRAGLKLFWWGFLVALLVAQGYAGTYLSKHSDTNALYHYSTAVGAFIVYGILFGAVLWIAGRDRRLLAFRRPSTGWLIGLGLALAVFVGTEVVNLAIDPFLHAGKEQGLVPTVWEPSKLGPYLANWVAVAGAAPLVEEATFRGLGFSLLSDRYGKWIAIAAIGLLFAASHGLLKALPELALLGGALAWLRWRTDSILPGMIVHCVFNSLALAVVLFDKTA